MVHRPASRRFPGLARVAALLCVAAGAPGLALAGEACDPASLAVINLSARYASSQSMGELPDAGTNLAYFESYTANLRRSMPEGAYASISDHGKKAPGAPKFRKAEILKRIRATAQGKSRVVFNVTGHGARLPRYDENGRFVGTEWAMILPDLDEYMNWLEDERQFDRFAKVIELVSSDTASSEEYWRFFGDPGNRARYQEFIARAGSHFLSARELGRELAGKEVLGMGDTCFAEGLDAMEGAKSVLIAASSGRHRTSVGFHQMQDFKGRANAAALARLEEAGKALGKELAGSPSCPLGSERPGEWLKPGRSAGSLDRYFAANAEFRRYSARIASLPDGGEPGGLTVMARLMKGPAMAPPGQTVKLGELLSERNSDGLGMREPATARRGTPSKGFLDCPLFTTPKEAI